MRLLSRILGRRRGPRECHNVELGLAAIAEKAADENEVGEPRDRSGILGSDPLDRQYQLVADYCRRHTDVTISVREVQIEKESDEDA